MIKLIEQKMTEYESKSDSIRSEVEASKDLQFIKSKMLYRIKLLERIDMCRWFLSLLKSAHESNHQDFAHCSNTALGDSADTLAESETSTKLAGEKLSETGIVRQNEQTDEFCDRCGTKMYTRGIYVKCPSCDHW